VESSWTPRRRCGCAGGSVLPVHERSTCGGRGNRLAKGSRGHIQQSDGRGYFFKG
jgi:hypothetical protein